MTFVECLENLRRDMLNMLERLEERHERELAEAKEVQLSLSASHRQDDGLSGDVTKSDMGKSVSVSILNVQDIRDAASLLNMLQQDLQCVVEVNCRSSHRQPSAQLIASVVDSTVIPSTDVEMFQEVGEGESLSISIYDGSNWTQDYLVGSVTLSSSQFYASGFEGEVRLVDQAGTSKFTLDIAVRLSKSTHSQPYQQEETKNCISTKSVADVPETDSKLILLRALQKKGTDAEVIDLLKSKADANAEFSDVKCFGGKMKFSLCKPFFTRSARGPRILVFYTAGPQS